MNKPRPTKTDVKRKRPLGNKHPRGVVSVAGWGGVPRDPESGTVDVKAWLVCDSFVVIGTKRDALGYVTCPRDVRGPLEFKIAFRS